MFNTRINPGETTIFRSICFKSNLVCSWFPYSNLKGIMNINSLNTRYTTQFKAIIHAECHLVLGFIVPCSQWNFLMCENWTQTNGLLFQMQLSYHPHVSWKHMQDQMKASHTLFLFCSWQHQMRLVDNSEDFDHRLEKIISFKWNYHEFYIKRYWHSLFL